MPVTLYPLIWNDDVFDIRSHGQSLKTSHIEQFSTFKLFVSKIIVLPLDLGSSRRQKN